jgi:hypothetical protein
MLHSGSLGLPAILFQFRNTIINTGSRAQAAPYCHSGYN